MIIRVPTSKTGKLQLDEKLTKAIIIFETVSMEDRESSTRDAGRALAHLFHQASPAFKKGFEEGIAEIDIWKQAGNPPTSRPRSIKDAVNKHIVEGEKLV